MDARARKTTPDLNALINMKVTEETYAFNFFQLLRMIECADDKKPRIGMARRLSDEIFRLSQEPGMSFESASLTAFKPGGKGVPHRLRVRLLGMLGPNGPLPLHLTDYIYKRQLHQKDFTLARFLDIFNHRMLALFYRAWAINQPVVSFDRRKSDRFSTYIGSLGGLGMPAFKNRDEIPDLAKLYFIGRLSCQTKCPEGLAAIVSDYFKMSAHIKEFIGQWLKLPKNQICRLGIEPENGILGESTVIGKSVWGCQHKFRLMMGPVGIRDYTSLLPTGKIIHSLIAMVRNYIGDELAWDMNLILKKEEVPAVRLNGKFHLGWTSWLGKRASQKDADDLILNAMAYAKHS